VGLGLVGLTLEVDEDTVLAPPRFALTDDDCGRDLLTQLRLSLFAGRNDHVTDTGGRQTIQTTTNTLHGDDVQVCSADASSQPIDRPIVRSSHGSRTTQSIEQSFVQSVIRDIIQSAIVNR
jgi:hypothetical protein